MTGQTSEVAVAILAGV